MHDYASALSAPGRFFALETNCWQIAILMGKTVRKNIAAGR